MATAQTSTTTSTEDRHGWKNLAALLASVTAVQILGFALLPLLGRLYTKEDYGILGMLMSAVGLPSLLANARYDQATMVAREGPRLRLLRSLGLSINICITTLLIILCLIAPMWLEGSKYEIVTPYLFIIPFNTFFAGLYAIVQAHATARSRYRTLSVSGLLLGYINNILKVILGFAGMGVWGLAVAYNSGSATGSTFITLRVRESWTRSVTLWRMKVAAWHYRSFPKYTSWQAAISMLLMSLLPMLLPNFYEVGQIGLLTMLMLLTRRPVQVYSDTTGRLYARRFVEARETSKAFMPDFRKLLWRILRFGALLGILMPWIAEPLVTFILGDQWIELGQIIPGIVLFLALESICTIFSFVPDVLRLQRTYLAIQALRLALEITAIFVIAPQTSFKLFIWIYYGVVSIICIGIIYWFAHLIRQSDKSPKQIQSV